MITRINNKLAARAISYLLPLTTYLFTSCADLEQTSLSSIDRDNFYQSKEDI